MESGLLNAFHDDHFDDNYVKYENDTSLWSDGTENFGLQLTETLHGILPTTPTEEKLNYFDNDVETKSTFKTKQQTDTIENCYQMEVCKNDFIVTQYTSTDELYESMPPSVEIISVDPNCEFQSPLSVDDSDSDSSERDDSSNDDEESSNSDSSSSISDYESHSSDEESDKNNENTLSNNIELINKQNSVENIQNKKSNTYVNNTPIERQTDLLNLEHHKPKKRPYKKSLSLPLSPINSDFVEVLNYTNYSLDCIEVNEITSKLGTYDETYQKPLEAEIDEKHFDLATFITQDDYYFPPAVPEKSTTNIIATKAICNGKLSQNVKKEKSDSDTDESVDIETIHENPILKSKIDDVEFSEMNESFSHIDDDPIRDPSWSPTTTKNSKSSRVNTRSKTRSNNTNKVVNTKLPKTKITSVPQNNRNKKAQQNPTTLPEKPVYTILDRKKVGLGRGKNISMCCKPGAFDSDSESSEEHPKKDEKKSLKSSAIIHDTKIKVEREFKKPTVKQEILEEDKKPNLLSTKIKLENRIETNVKIDKVSKEEILKSNNKTDTVTSANIKVETPEAVGNKESTDQQATVVIPVKKKLNLEEYKRRREIQSSGGQKEPTKNNLCVNNIPVKPNNINLIDKLPNIAESKADMLNYDISDSGKNVNNCNNINSNSNPKQPSLLLPPNSSIRGTKYYDPIIEAKNKVLRMQELKRVARTKLIDSTVSAKVGPITKILPLEQITSLGKNNDNNINENSNNSKSLLKINHEYEEIIIVSVSSNTDISIPPVFEKPTIANSNNCSSSLLFNISDTIHKAHLSGDAVKISSNSLISSIQDVVLKKSGPDKLLSSSTSPFHKSPNVGVSPPSHFSPQKPEMSKTVDCNKTVQTKINNKNAVDNVNNSKNKMEHGEDKIIMHLRKDRIREKTQSISTQTDFLPQFPALKLLHIDIRKSSTKFQQTSHNQDKARSRHRRNYRSRHSMSCSSDEENYKSRSRSSFRSTSSHDTSRSNSPRNHHSTSDRRNNIYRSSNRRTISPHRKRQKRSRSRSSSRNNTIRRRISRSRTRTSSSSSDSDRVERHDRSHSRSRHRRRRDYSRSPSTDSNYTSKSRSRSRSSRSRSRSKSRSRYRRTRSRSIHQRRDRLSSPAVEERRIVYVGRIERETSKEDLKRKFISYGPIRKITLHYKDTGMKYGFVTFERAQDAFKAIDNAIRDSKINMYDVSFGGRRAFCRASYSDLDNAATNSLQVLPYNSTSMSRSNEDESFEALLQKVKKKISATKSTASSPRSKT